MEPVEIVATALRALNALNVPYMLVGSMSSNLYGEPRMTKDADVVVQLGGTSLSLLVEKMGPGFRVDRQMGFETVTGTTRYHIEHVEGEFLIELFELTDDPHNQERFARRREVQFAGIRAYAATAEDVIIQKLRWYKKARRAKDIQDAQNVFGAQAGRLDLAYMQKWCDVHGTQELLGKLIADSISR